MKTKIKVVSLFSGCGGTDLALSQMGFDIVFSNDIWEMAIRTYKDNISDANVHCGDIAQFKAIPDADLLVGCYPCQGFTQGGRRRVGDSVNFLYQEFDRVLRLIRPKAFIVENVNGMTFGDNAILLNNQIVRYRMAGYRVKCRVLNAMNYGVAQNRKRVFLVGVRSDLDFTYEFPTPTHGSIDSPSLVTQHDVMEGLPDWPEGEFNSERFHWYYLSRNRYRSWNEPSCCIVGHWRHVPLHPGSSALLRLSTDEWQFADPDRQNRRLSYRECAALQGFPREFTFDRGTVRDRFQMIGNAVPPPLFKAVASPLSSLW